MARTLVGMTARLLRFGAWIERSLYGHGKFVSRGIASPEPSVPFRKSVCLARRCLGPADSGVKLQRACN
jgi:hypothetical protein